MASGSKVASVFFLVRLVAAVPEGDQSAAMVFLPLALIAVLSILIGNLGALRQSNLKRLLAYASIANGGYLLIGLVASYPDGASVPESAQSTPSEALSLSAAGLPPSPDGFAAALFYVVVYALANLGAFGIIGLLADRMKGEDKLEDFAGAWKRHPGLSFAFLLFLLSSAGIPPLAGFVGKYYLFYAAFGQVGDSYVLNDFLTGRSGWMVFLVALALVMSVISLYYYVKILKAFLVSEEESSHLEDAKEICPGVKLSIFALALLILGLGVYPEPLMELFRSGFAG